jgi:hypothetical protein
LRASDAFFVPTSKREVDVRFNRIRAACRTPAFARSV